MIKCLSYRPVNKGNCLGFANVEVDVLIDGISTPLVLNGLTLNEKNGRKWIGFPSKQYEKDGEKKYAPYFRLPDTGMYRTFCAQIKEIIQKKISEEGFCQDDSSLSRADTNPSSFSGEEIPF